MLRVAEQYVGTDTGRQRRANEDSMLARSPLFVVADGMGGAQAGEVASRLAIESFEHGLDDTTDAEGSLAAYARAANVSIHERSQADAAHAGMGTTLTAVYVGAEEVAIAHVGDSRAYCLRDGELLRLTDDHSLVDELIRQGKLTPEEAVEHPQRSVITRALGPEPEVEIDTRSYRARDGDVYLLCSDGLTTMVPDGRLAEILLAHGRLRGAGEALIAAANEAGGRDNITVVLLRVEEVALAPGSLADDPATLTGIPMLGANGAVESISATGDERQSRRVGGVAAPATLEPPLAHGVQDEHLVGPRRPRHPSPAAAPHPRRRRRLRRVLATGIVLGVLALIAAGVYVTAQSVYFIGTNSRGLVTMYSGFPYELPGGLKLYAKDYVSGVSATTLSAQRRRTLLDHSLRSEADAAELVRSLELGELNEGIAAVNRPIVRLYGLVVLLFALLIAFTSRWTIFEASSLRSSPLNARALLEQERIARGPILASNGEVLARSVRGAEGTYRRSYPSGSLFAQTVGYAYTDLTQTGIERYRNTALNGETSASNLQAILDQLQGKRRQGDEVLTTLDPSAQRTAIAALGEHSGAVVALDPRDGAVKVMASSPSYDPNTLSSPSSYERLAHQSSAPLLNRALQFGYAPGSTFKVVTATAAIDTGQFTPSSTLSGRNDLPVSGVPLANDYDESFGELTLTAALAKSVNTVWAQVAEHVGKRTLARYMNRFGFDAKPQLDYPADEMSASGSYEGERLLPPTSPLIDVGRMGIGQDKLQVTPLQMAEVAAAVANHGKLMAPHLTDRIVDPEGRTVEQVSPRVQSVVMKPSTATAVTSMMEAVVNEGTGTPAQIPGVQVAGKTGTAETQVASEDNNVWFIAFAPAANPTVAIAVTIKGVPGFGATYAAPVAKQVMEVLLHG